MKNSVLSIKCCCLGIALAGLTVTKSVAQTPYGWRGAERNGSYSETGLLKSWPAGGPKLLWESDDVGKGYSSPVIVGDRLYITGLNDDEEKEIFLAYTLDGKKIYETTYGNPWTASYPDARVTPAIEGNRAYVISGMGEVVCINVANGAIVWQMNGTTLGLKPGAWGTSECPLVFDNKIILTPCGDQTTMVAMNTATGEIVWKSEPLGDLKNYASPILITHNGKKQIIGVTGNNIIGVHPETGKIEWRFSDWGEDNEWEKIAPNAPLYHNGRIFFSCGYDMGSIMLQLNTDATAVSLVWRNKAFDTHHGGYVLVDGTLYGSNWTSNTAGNWIAVDWNSGTTKYETQWGSQGKGSVVTADKMLYCYDERRGIVALGKPNPEKFDIVSDFRITKGDGPHWAHPVINNGILYIRHGSALMAYQIK